MMPGEADREIFPPRFNLLPDLIRIWRVHLDRASVNCSRLEEILSHDELDRALRFRFDRDRRRFTVARGALRMILGGYLNTDPKLIVFDYGAKGKPSLLSWSSEIRFNVAHSEELALIAVARERDLGVDVEYVRPLASAEQIPERFFSPREATVFRSLPDDLSEAAFFACWTRKEAYVKARGGGLSIPLDQFDVSLEPNKPAALLDVKGDPAEVSRWGMVELQPAPRYTGALVARGKDWRFSYCDWTG
jgi:4'-phosphopantetheinyl transferase